MGAPPWTATAAENTEYCRFTLRYNVMTVKLNNHQNLTDFVIDAKFVNRQCVPDEIRRLTSQRTTCEQSARQSALQDFSELHLTTFTFLPLLLLFSTQGRVTFPEPDKCALLDHGLLQTQLLSHLNSRDSGF